MSNNTSKLFVRHEPKRSLPCTTTAESPTLLAMDRERRKRHIFKAPQNVCIEINQTTGTTETIKRLASYGITAFYYNLAMGSIEENRLVCRTIKEIVRQPTIVAGITGRLPKIGRLCPHGKEVWLNKKRQFILTADRRFTLRGSRRAAYANCYDFLSITQPQDIILIGRRIQLFVVKVIHDSIVCRVKKGGRICPNDRVYFVDEPFDIDAKMSTEEHDDLSVAFEHEIDLVLVPVARGPEYVASIRALIDVNRGRHVMLLTRLSSIALETEQMATNIADTYDGIVHRFVKGFQPPIDDTVDDSSIWPTESETHLFELCHKLKKPICVWLENNQLPSIHSERLKLLYYYPDTFVLQCDVDTVDLERIMQNQQQICRSYNGFVNCPSATDNSPLLFNAAITVRQVNAKAIILMTYSGRAPITLSNYRPNCKIIAITSSSSTAQKLGLYRGIKVAKIEALARTSTIEVNAWIAERNEKLSFGLKYGHANRWLLEGDTVILLYRSKRGLGHCNELKIVQI